MRSLSLYKIVLILSVILSLASCDTGYSGDIDPNNEVFNYKYPLQKGNTWTYLVKERKYNFSNPAALAEIGADTVLYYQVKQICSNDTAWFSYVSKSLHKLDSYQSSKASNQALIDTTVCPAKSSFYMDNTSDYYLEYGRRDSTTISGGGGSGTVTSTIAYETPFKILKYGTYTGNQWIQGILMSEVRCKISGFLDLDNERVCQIIKTEYIPESPATPAPADTVTTDEYYSQRGLVKSIRKDFKKSMMTPNGNATTYDHVITTELIRTNVK